MTLTAAPASLYRLPSTSWQPLAEMHEALLVAASFLACAGANWWWHLPLAVTGLLIISLNAVTFAVRTEARG